MKIVERFQMTGRGLAVVVNEMTDLPVGKKLTARVVLSDGVELTASAYKEWLLRRNPRLPVEKEAFLLVGLDMSDVPEGSEIHLTL